MGEKMKKKLCILSTLFMSLFFLTENVFASSFECSALDGVQIDEQVPHILKYVILIIQILVPVLLVIFGTIDLLKGVYAQKEDEIKKGQQIFIKRLISGLLVFFVKVIVKLFVSVFVDSDKPGIMNCVNCLISGPEKNEGKC